MDGIEAVLAQRLETLLGAGSLPNLEALREEFAPRQSEPPTVCVQIPAVDSYDTLLSEAVPA